MRDRTSLCTAGLEEVSILLFTGCRSRRDPVLVKRGFGFQSARLRLTMSSCPLSSVWKVLTRKRITTDAAARRSYSDPIRESMTKAGRDYEYEGKPYVSRGTA